MEFYKELLQVEELRDRIKSNQDQVLDFYNYQQNGKHSEKLKELLLEMNSILEEVNDIEEGINRLTEKYHV